MKHDITKYGKNELMLLVFTTKTLYHELLKTKSFRVFVRDNISLRYIYTQAQIDMLETNFNEEKKELTKIKGVV